MILAVPGATLHYEVRGTGATLLLVPGGPEDASGYAELASLLAADFRVVTYDPRGVSRSRLDLPADIPVTTAASDAAALLREVGGGPALVLGESGGAVIGLELVSAFPDLVRQLVAHEPPCPRLLPEPEPVLAELRAVVEVFHRDGVGAGMGRFLDVAGFDTSAPSPEPRESVVGNLDFFLRHLLLETVDRYTPDVAVLRTRPVTVTVGRDSVGELPYRTASALAERLGQEPVAMPGNHFGIQTFPQEFAAALRGLADGYAHDDRSGRA